MALPSKQRGGKPSDFWRSKSKKSNSSLVNKSAKFFRNLIDKLDNRKKVKKISKFGWKRVSVPQIGKMYFYAYDPKHKKTLPVYDRFPLMLPIKYYKDGWLGCNLHYLPPELRYQFLHELIRIGGNPAINDKTKLKLNYQLLNAIATSKLFEPTIHRYLSGHVASPITLVHPEDWEKVVFLPTARWVGRKPY